MAGCCGSGRQSLLDEATSLSVSERSRLLRSGHVPRRWTTASRLRRSVRTPTWSATNNNAVGLVDLAGKGPAAATVAFRTRV
jgi:hypothetical protein